MDQWHGDGRWFNVCVDSRFDNVEEDHMTSQLVQVVFHLNVSVLVKRSLL